jgi:hypothetical protein
MMMVSDLLVDQMVERLVPKTLKCALRSTRSTAWPGASPVFGAYAAPNRLILPKAV